MSFFTKLPVELISLIIHHTIPESFVGIALSCRWVYKLCNPFIAEYNRLRRAFRSFRYGTKALGAHSIKSALELILEISKSPIIAKYIQNGDFSGDCFYVRGKHITVPSEHDSKMILQLLDESQYLKQAGNDSREYFSFMQKSLDESRDNPAGHPWYQPHFWQNKYSQHAAAFLLTLLPNLKQLELPVCWASLRETDQLIETIVARSKIAQSLLPSLGQTQVIRAEYRVYSQVHSSESYLAKVGKLLAISNARSFVGTGYCIEESLSITFGPYPFLTSLQLINCGIDHKAVSGLLQHTPAITIFQYSHSVGQNYIGSWNVSLFLKAIEHSVGANLKTLSIKEFEPTRGTTDPRTWESCIRESSSLETPDTVSMLGFLRLRQLDLPQELLCTIDAITIETHGPKNMSALIPKSVLRLSIYAKETLAHQQALNIVLDELISRKKSQRLALQDVAILTHRQIREAFEPQFAARIQELNNLGVGINWSQNAKDPFS